MGNKIKVPGIVKARYRNLSANLKQNKKTLELMCFVNAGIPSEYRPTFTITQCTKEESDSLKGTKNEVLELGKDVIEVGEAAKKELISGTDSDNIKEKSEHYYNKVTKLTKEINKKKNECFEILVKHIVDWDNFIDLEEEEYVNFVEDDGHISKELFYETIGHPEHEAGFQLVCELIEYSSEIPEDIKEQVKS